MEFKGIPGHPNWWWMLLYNVSEEFHCKTFGKLQLIGDISPIKLKIANLAILDVTGKFLFFFFL